MEKLTATISQYINPDRLERAVPEYLWFVIAVVFIGGFFFMFRMMINFLTYNLKELKNESSQHSEEIAAIHETLKGIKEILTLYGNDIRDLRTKRRGQ